METNFEENKVKVANEIGYIKLMKNETSKGVVRYAWDIKAVANEDDEPLKKLVLLIEELNDQMGMRFKGDGI